MTANKRYSGHNIDPSIDEILVRPTPISLTPAEIDAERHPLTKLDTPIEARAWVRFPEAVIQPECVVLAFNDRAVQIQWTMKSGATKTTWVWRGAVTTRREARR